VKAVSDLDREKLRFFNQAVESAILARQKWLDENVPKYAEAQIGEDLFDLETGRSLGVVTAHTRCHRNSGSGNYYDNSLAFAYEVRPKGDGGYASEGYPVASNSRDRYSESGTGTQAQAIERAQWRLAELQRRFPLPTP
jgi:hypothetical protein